MKIAILHSFMDNIGGAEMVSLTLAREFNAHIYTTNIDPDKIIKMGFDDVLPNIKSIGKVSKRAPFRHQITLHKFRKLNLKNQYDFFIITGDWAMSGAVNNQPNMWYVHSPLNEIWGFRKYIKKEILSFWKKPFFDIFVLVNKFLTLKYAKSINVWVANSENTKERIENFYKKSATVINPPVYTDQYLNQKNKNFWLSVNRLITHKRIELQLKALEELPNENLIIVGSYEKGVEQFEKYKKYLEAIKAKNVKIIHWLEEKELKKLYSECKGLLATAKNEDFGMTPIEAMASGKPVIAANEGGYRESILNKETGILIDDIDTQKLKSEIVNINKELEDDDQKYKDKCLEQSKKFDTKVFIEKIKNLIQI